MRSVRLCLIVHSAERPIVCRNIGAITLVVASITPTADLEGEHNCDAGLRLGNRRRCILRFPAVRHGGEVHQSGSEFIFSIHSILGLHPKNGLEEICLARLLRPRARASAW